MYRRKFVLVDFSSNTACFLSLFLNNFLLCDNSTKRIFSKMKHQQCSTVKMQALYHLTTRLLANCSFSEQHIRDSHEFNMNVWKNDLIDLQRLFIIAPVDKASNNFCSICKKFYLKVLMDGF